MESGGYGNINDNRMTLAKKTGEEIDYLEECINVDMDIGEDNDFKFSIPLCRYQKEKYDYGNRIFIAGTEYGGTIDSREVDTNRGMVDFEGIVWRKYLTLKVVEPPDGEEHLYLDGEINDVIRKLLDNRFDGLFFVPAISTGVSVKHWKVDRYVSLYDAIMKLLDEKGMKLKITYIQPESLEYGYVEVQAVPVEDLSKEIEYSNDGKINYKIREYKGGITHLICAGKGQNEERIIIHLFVQKDGSIGKDRYYKGLDEREAVYEFTSAESDKLEEDGIKRLKELQNYKKMELTANDVDIDLGDIVGGYEEYTENEIKKPIQRKILKIKDGKIEIDYKVKGED